VHHSDSDAHADSAPDPAGKGLRTDSVGLLAVVALGLASVAPAYSIAVTLGFVVMVVGHLAPAALLVGFVPILLTAFAFRELNREMPDCGTTFVWNTRAFGPYAGWLSGGWVVQIATVIAMTALARVGAGYLLTLFGLDSLASNNVAVIATAVLILAVVTAIAYRGLQIAAEVQYVLLGLQLIALFGFGIAAFARDGAETPSPSWLNPLAFDGFGPFAEAVLLCLFIYWGWDALITRQRGDEGQGQDARPRGRDLHRAAARHLPVHRLRRHQLRGDRHRRTGSRQCRQRGRRAGDPRAARARHRTGQGGRVGHLRLGDRGIAHLRDQ
jgi:hypothetical protein